jgi:hypothetical protein
MRWLPLLLAAVSVLSPLHAKASQAPSPRLVEDSFAMDPGALDFIRGEGIDQRILQFLCGDALVGTDATGRIVPRLAKSWEVRPGELRFSLRRDATYADGRHVEPKDVQWTLQALLQDPKASPVKRQLLQGCSVGVQAGQVVLRHPKPAERMLRELATIPIARAGRSGEGSGPFHLDRSGGGEWFLSRRAHFLGPKVDGFHFRLLPDAQGILLALQKGWLHLGVPPVRTQAAPPPGYRVIMQDLPGQLVVWSRVGPAPLRWRALWRASAFPPHLLGASAVPSQSLWPRVLGFKARDLPAPKGPLGSRELLYPGGDPTLEAQLQALAARSARDGATLRLQPLAPQVLEQRLAEGHFELACAVVTFDPHPWSILDLLDPSGPYNFGGFKDAAVAPLIKALDRPDAPAWAQLEARWAEGATALPLLDYRSVLWVHAKLEVIPSPVGLYFSTPGPAGWRWH